MILIGNHKQLLNDPVQHNSCFMNPASS